MAVGCFMLSFGRSGKLPVAVTPEQGHGGARDRADQGHPRAHGAFAKMQSLFIRVGGTIDLREFYNKYKDK